MVIFCFILDKINILWITTIAFMPYVWYHMNIKRRLRLTNSCYMSKYHMGWRAIKDAAVLKRKRTQIGIMKRIWRTLFKQKKTSLRSIKEVRSMRVARLAASY